MNEVLVLMLTLIAYMISLMLKKHVKHSLVNPVLVSALLILFALMLGDVAVEQYRKHSSIITMFLNPLIMLLAIPLYRKRALLLSNLVPILSGVIMSIIVAFTSVYTLSWVLGIDNQLMVTLLPKSITTPLAIEASNALGGIPSITVLAVIVTGISGTLLYDLVVKIFKVKSDLAKGISLGATSHAIGTSKAIEVSEETGASSSLALGLSGIITVVIVIIMSHFI